MFATLYDLVFTHSYVFNLVRTYVYIHNYLCTCVCAAPFVHEWRCMSKNHLLEMIYLYVRHDSFICVTWFIHICDMTHSYVWHDSFTCVTWLIHMCDMTHSYARENACISVICVYMWDMTHSHVWHNSFTCVTWLLDECTGSFSFYPHECTVIIRLSKKCEWFQYIHMETHTHSHTHSSIWMSIRLHNHWFTCQIRRIMYSYVYVRRIIHSRMKNHSFTNEDT